MKCFFHPFHSFPDIIPNLFLGYVVFLIVYLFILFIVLVDIFFPAYSISGLSPVQTVTPSVIKKGKICRLKFVEY